MFVPQQLERLTRSVPFAGPRARAIAVYAEAPSVGDSPDLVRAAREQGFEGVACVDDAARAVVLYCTLWRHSPQPRFRDAALALTEFVVYMQAEDGRFANFLLNWNGARNLTGATSSPGGAAWQARAVHALACVAATFGLDTWDERFQRGMRWLDEPVPYLDVRAVGVLAAVQHWRATGERRSAVRALGWSAEIYQARADDRLLNARHVTPIHLWGHLQEYALAEVGVAFERPDLVEAARRSADAVLVPALDWCRTAEQVLPFDMSCTAIGLAAVGRTTGLARYHEAALLAQAWFSGRNSACAPVYDAERGTVFDGVDAGAVSRNSGAESNIEGGLALLATADGATFAAPLRSIVNA
jgi:hypothetical protein